MTRILYLPATVNTTQLGLKSYLVKSLEKFIAHIESTVLDDLREEALAARANGEDDDTYITDLDTIASSLTELQDYAHALSPISVGIMTLPVERNKPSDKTVFEKNLFGEDVIVEYLNNVRAVMIDEPHFTFVATKKYFDAWCNQIDLAVPKD